MKTLSNKTLASKPVYLMTTKEELIAERNRMEANWDESMRKRMSDVGRMSFMLFKTPLALLR